jgi:putative FmdB family regulatory protein
MPTYNFQCKKCKHYFEEICSFSDCDKGFPDVRCEKCNSKQLKKNILDGNVPGAMFSDPRGTSKWDNFEYRAGFNMEKAKKERQAAEEKVGGRNPYRNIDDTNRGNRMNFID